MSKQHSLDHILCISGHPEALKMPKAAREGLRPFEPGVKEGTPPLKIPCSIYFSGEGAAKNSGHFSDKVIFCNKT